MISRLFLFILLGFCIAVSPHSALAQPDDGFRPSSTENPECAGNSAPGSTDFPEGESCRLRRNVPVMDNGVVPPSIRVFGDCRGSGCHRPHTGMDLTMPNGHQFPLPQGCKIIMNGSTPIHNTDPGGYGPSMHFDCSELAGGNDVKVMYAHLDGYDSDTGMAINGCGGNASCNSGLGAHVHLEIRIDGKRVDPACVWGEWFKGGDAASADTEIGAQMAGKIWQQGRPGGEKPADPPCLAPLQNGTPADLCNSEILAVLKEDAERKIGGKSSGGANPDGEKVDPETIAGTGSYMSPPGSEAGHDHDDIDPDTLTQVTPDVETTGEGTEDARCDSGCCPCTDTIVNNHKKIRSHIDEFTPEEKDGENSEFEEHRKWLVYTYFHQHVLRAAEMMTSQLTSVGMEQIQSIGRLLDAKHQSETQRLFQQLKAQAHKDYQPSEGLCEIGTNVRSLAASERLADLAHLGLSQQAMQRQLLSGQNAAQEGPSSDKPSRLENFIKKFCNPNDNGKGLQLLCGSSSVPKDSQNADIDFTRSVETKLTLDIDFTQAGDTAEDDTIGDDEKVEALMANLLGHDLFPKIGKSVLAAPDGQVRQEAVRQYMKARALIAKRSVAVNSMSALLALRASGDPEVAPFAKKLVTELGISENDIEDLLGENPSYFAQMEVLAKKAYTNPTFYTELYDSPVNVDRKNLALRAIGIMQERDLYKSILRSEASMAIILEQMLNVENDRMKREFMKLNDQVRGAKK